MTILFSSKLSQEQTLATKIFSAAIKEGKLAQAYILVGHALENKWQLILQLTAYFNCEKIKSGQNSACLLKEESKDWCTNCRWLTADEHPQALLKLSGQQSKSGKIAVEQARNLVEEISKTSPYFRVIAIDDASQDILHRPAANALLKTIEEPRSNVLMIFFAPVISEVLPTVVSRCQVINMSSDRQNDKQLLSLNSLSNNLQYFFSDEITDQQKKQIENILVLLEKFTGNSDYVDAINLIEAIQIACKEDDNLEIMLDFLVANDLLNCKNLATKNQEARYAKELFLLNQIAKEQSKHYVSQKALIETFVFAWHKLKKTGINPLKIRG